MPSHLDHEAMHVPSDTRRPGEPPIETLLMTVAGIYTVGSMILTGLAASRPWRLSLLAAFGTSSLLGALVFTQIEAASSTGLEAWFLLGGLMFTAFAVVDLVRSRDS